MEMVAGSWVKATPHPSSHNGNVGRKFMQSSLFGGKAGIC